jgi:predicted metal-dependent phosphoesterase TrpH
LSEHLKFESLHSHTVLSDGVMTHRQVLDAAEQLGIGVVAFTDHDTLPDNGVMADLRAYDGPVKWTVGIELSSMVPAAAGGIEKGNVHILGLFTDIQDRPLREFCQAAEDSRMRRMKKYVAHLRSLGFTISEADILSVATSKNIASPHMVKALWLHPENRAVMEQIKSEMKAAAEHDEALAAKYAQTEKEGANQWPYTLFMGGHSFKPAPRTGFDVLRPYEDSVKLIRDAGGVALATHWHVEEEKMNEAELEAVLKVGGLDGIESESVNMIGLRDGSQGAKRSRVLIERYDLLETLGSDSHTREDLEVFVKSSAAHRSIGHTARLLARVKPDLSWSRL